MGEEDPVPDVSPSMHPGRENTKPDMTAGNQITYTKHIDEIRRLYAVGEVEAALDLARHVTTKTEPPLRTSVLDVVLSAAEIRTLPLDPRTAFLLTHIDGVSTVQQVIDVSGMNDGEALGLLERLSAVGAVTLRTKEAEHELLDLTLDDGLDEPTLKPTKDSESSGSA